MSCKRTFEWIHMETIFDGAIEHVEVDDARGVLAITGMGRVAIYVAKMEGANRCTCLYGRAIIHSLYFINSHFTACP